MASLQPPHLVFPGPPAEVSEEEDLYGEDDAQSFVQPSISPIATYLASSKTPAAEMTAAMHHIVPRCFDGSAASKTPESSGEDPSNQDELLERHCQVAPSGVSDGRFQLRSTTSVPPPPAQSTNRLPMPPTTRVWGNGMAHRDSEDHRPALENVSLHPRSSSAGVDALRRLSRVLLPPISLPSNLIHHRLPTPSFFSSNLESCKSDSRDPTPNQAPPAQSPPLGLSNKASAPPTTPPYTSSPAHQKAKRDPSIVRRPSLVSDVSRESLVVRRSPSADSMLYHSLSRTSSFGDDKRFSHVHEQVNSRFKAIVDSFDTPSFKLPSMPGTLLSPLKKTEFSASSVVTELSSKAPRRTVKDPRDSLDAALEGLTGDLVIMGGYRGSILRSADPPHRQLWVPIKVGLNVRKVNLKVGLLPEDEEAMEQSIVPSGMLKNIGPVDISKRLFKRLREYENVRNGKLRIHNYGYDWRLSPHLLSRKLIEFLRTLPSNQGEKPSGALVIAHSLGGVISRHAVNQVPQLFSGVVYAGVPQRCINILGPLRNGDAVLLNEKVLTAQVNFSLRTTFVFLPEDGFCFIDSVTDKEYLIDFYDPNEWVRYRLCPSVGGPALPAFTAKRNSALGSLLSLSDLSISRGRTFGDAATRRPAARTSPLPRKSAKKRALVTQMDGSAVSKEDDASRSRAPSPKADDVKVPGEKKFAYLTRTLAQVKRFRAELQHNPSHQAANFYPPIAVIYAKGIPTVYAARVACREAIACSDSYDDLAFGSGDGVVLARQAMPPPGYAMAKGGRISTDKGHISILGDLAAVGRALAAVVRGRKKGIGLGLEKDKFDAE